MRRVAPLVQVLLPTYNGERHLRELLDSLRRQDHRPLHLRVRDDGSTDGTVELVHRFAACDDIEVEVDIGDERLGPYQSFMRLLADADPAADLVAFADQDDVWLPDKISRAVRTLEGTPAPACYGAAVQVTDRTLQPLSTTRGPAAGPSFGHALFETVAPASTLVLTAAARRLLVARLPAVEVYPDLWCYQVCSALGRFVYDSEPVLLYRQHGDNAIGVGVTARDRWTRRLRRARAHGPGLGPRHWQQLQELRHRFGDVLPASCRAELDALLGTRERWRTSAAYALRGPVVRTAKLDALALRATLLLPPTRG